MFRGTTILAGPARSGKTHRLLAAFRRVLAEGHTGAALWLSPTQRAAASVRQRLLDSTLKACLSPHCMTFDQFGARVMDCSPVAGRPISTPLVRHILSKAVALAGAQNELDYFRPIAATRGFIDLLVQWIQELKRLEIWPEELRAAGGARPTRKHRELCLIYESYQQLLTRHDLYDAQGRLWAARAWLREGGRAPFEQVRHVFVDGFDDLTRTEHEVLQILAGRVDSLTITVPWEQPCEREELFAKSKRTVEELKRRHVSARIEFMPPRPLECDGLTHVERHLFGNPRSIEPAADAGGIDVVPATGATDEIEQVARRIKQLLVRGDPSADQCPVRPQEIVVVFRSLDETAELVQEVFGRFGIPTAISTSSVLASAPIMSALGCWLKLDRDDWRFRDVLRLLGHNYVRLDWPEFKHRRAVDAAVGLVHELQIPAGRDELLANVQRLAGRRDGAGNPETRKVRLRQQAALAEPLLARVAAILDALPVRAGISEWSAAITQLAQASGMLAGGPLDAASDAQTDREAWQQLLAALAARGSLSRWLNADPEVYSRENFCALLDDLLASEPLASDRDDTGRVRVLSAEGVRNLTAPYVFACGLSEQSFPPSLREDCLYNQAETQQLVSAGLPLVPHALRRGHEMLLFYEVVTRATRRLTLSFPALDQTALPLSPSPYVRDLERLFLPTALLIAPAAQLSSVPQSDDVYSVRDYRVRAVARVLDGDGTMLAGLGRHALAGPAGKNAAVPTAENITVLTADNSAVLTADNIVQALHTTESRRRGKSFGPFEGMLYSDSAHSTLAERYGPERCWSPSQLEQYAMCPYQFFLRNVLRLEALDAPGLESDYMGRGQIVHWVLAEVHRRLNRDSSGPSSPSIQPEGEFHAAAQAVLRELIDEMLSDRDLQNGLLEIDARRVGTWLADYYRQHGEYDAQWSELPRPPRPAHFEVAFGPARRQNDPEEPHEIGDPLSSSEAFELQCGGETIRFAGRIDRVDVGEVAGQTVFNIVDYKSGKPSKRTNVQSVFDGYALQLPIYALAAERLLADRGAVPFRAAYWHVAADGYREKNAIGFHLEGGGSLSIDPNWEALAARLRQRIGALVRGIRQGEFPMHSADEKCTSYCDFHTVCRVNQVRGLQKTWQPPGEDQA